MEGKLVGVPSVFFTGTIRFAQKEGEFKQKAIDFAAKLGFRPTNESLDWVERPLRF